MPTLYVYSREGCHLCDVLIEQLLPMIRGRIDLEIRDIDANPAWHERYGCDIPVVEYDGEAVCMHFLDRDAIAGILRR